MCVGGLKGAAAAHRVKRSKKGLRSAYSSSCTFRRASSRCSRGVHLMVYVYV